MSQISKKDESSETDEIVYCSSRNKFQKSIVDAWSASLVCRQSTAEIFEIELIIYLKQGFFNKTQIFSMGHRSWGFLFGELCMSLIDLKF